MPQLESSSLPRVMAASPALLPKTMEDVLAVMPHSPSKLLLRIAEELAIADLLAFYVAASDFRSRGPTCSHTEASLIYERFLDPDGEEAINVDVPAVLKVRNAIADQAITPRLFDEALDATSGLVQMTPFFERLAASWASETEKNDLDANSVLVEFRGSLGQAGTTKAFKLGPRFTLGDLQAAVADHLGKKAEKVGECKFYLQYGDTTAVQIHGPPGVALGRPPGLGIATLERVVVVSVAFGRVRSNSRGAGSWTGLVSVAKPSRSLSSSKDASKLGAAKDPKGTGAKDFPKGTTAKDSPKGTAAKDSLKGDLRRSNSTSKEA